jgi:hypothetical protein
VQDWNFPLRLVHGQVTAAEELERERKKEQTTLERWCFSEYLMEIKLVLSGNVHSLE